METPSITVYGTPTRSRTPGLEPYVLTHFQSSGIPIFGKSREIPDFRESGKFFPIFGNPGIYFGRDSRIPGFKIEIGNDFTTINQHYVRLFSKFLRLINYHIRIHSR